MIMSTAVLECTAVGSHGREARAIRQSFCVNMALEEEQQYVVFTKLRLSKESARKNRVIYRPVSSRSGAVRQTLVDGPSVSLSSLISVTGNICNW